MHDHHEAPGAPREDEFGFHQNRSRWLVGVWPVQAGRAWFTSVVDDAADYEDAIRQMAAAFPVSSPFRAWAFPMTDGNAAMVEATIELEIRPPAT